MNLWADPTLWNDLRIVFTIIFFLFLMKWSSEFTGSKAIGVILAAIISYLTFYKHFELLIIILILFFAYPFFSAVAEGLSGK